MGKRTSEQEGAFAELRAIAEPHRLRVRADVEGFPVIAGRFGQIEWTGGPDLAVWCDRPRLFRRIWSVSGVRRHQTGDTEIRALFPAQTQTIKQMAALIRARRRRQGRPLSPEAAKRLRDARVGATSAAKEPRSPIGTGITTGAGRHHALRRVLARRPGERA